MKKLLALLLAVLMLLLCVGCDTDTPPDDGGKNNTTTTTDNNNGSNSKPNDPNNGGEKEITFTGLVAVDNAECSIKITEIDPENIWGYTLKVQLENKSEDKTYRFSVESAAVNDVQCSTIFSTQVSAGKKANEKIILTDDSLKENGITVYTDIELTFRVYDSDDWLADPVAKETVHVYPYGSDMAESFVRVQEASDNVIVDNEYVTVIVTGYEEDEIWGYTVNVFLLNKSDKEIMYSVREASVNGYMVDPIFAAAVLPGKCAFDNISWSYTALEENGITDVEEIQFNLRAYDTGNILGDDFVNEVITLDP